MRSHSVAIPFLAFALLTLAFSHPAHAAGAGASQAASPQNATAAARPQPTDDPGDWEFAVAPYLWLPWVNADVTADGNSVSETLNPSDILKAFDFGLMGTAEVMYRRRWFANLDTLFFLLDQDSEVGPVFRTLGPVRIMRPNVDITIPAVTAMAGPLDVDTNVTQLVMRGVLGYRLLSRPMSDVFGGGHPGDERKLNLDVFAGGRLWYIKTELDVDGAPISIPGTTGRITFPSHPHIELPGLRIGPITGPQINVDAEDTVWWVDPIVGTRVGADLSDRFFLRVMGNIGGFNWGSASKLSWETLQTVGYRPKKNWTIEGGYRALGVEREKGADNANIIMHGPIFGFSYSF